MARSRTRGVGARIRRLRRRLGLTQAQLAGGKLSKSYISQIETGRVKPSDRALRYLARRLGKTPEFLQQDDNVGARIRLLVFTVQNCIRRREMAEAKERLREAAELAMRAEDQLQLAQVHECAGHLYVATGHFEEATRAFREAISILRGVENMDRIASLHCSLANVLALQGKIDAAQGEIRAAQDIYTRGLDPDHLILGRSYLVAGSIALAAGQPQTAQRLVEQALSLLQARDIVGTGESRAVLGISLLHSGNPAGAVASLQEALRLLEGVSDPPALAVINRFLAEALARCNEPLKATAAVHRAGSLASHLRDRMAVVWAAVRLAELALATNDGSTAVEASDEAQRLLDEGTPGGSERDGDAAVIPVYAHGRHDWLPVLRARLARVKARLASSAGLEEQSLAELRSAVRSLLAADCAAPLLVEVCQQLVGRLRSAGRLEEALACASEALAAVGRRSTAADPILSPLELAALPSQLWFRG